jgi:hypothetical protein
LSFKEKAQMSGDVVTHLRLSSLEFSYAFEADPVSENLVFFAFGHSLLSRLETYLAMRAVAEGLPGGRAAAAQRNRIAVRRYPVAFRVEKLNLALHQVRPILQRANCDFCHLCLLDRN